MEFSKEDRFVLTLPLKTELFQEHILEKRFEIGRKLYNSLLNKTAKRYEQMTRTKVYRKTTNQLLEASKQLEIEEKKTNKNKTTIRNLKKEKKEALDTLNQLRKEYRISEFDFFKDMTPMRLPFKKNIDSLTAQAIAGQVWRAFESVIFGKGDKFHFKKHNEFNSLAGKTNTSGIRYFKDEKILSWNGLKMPVMVDLSNNYEVKALDNDICYSQIVSKTIGNKTRYFAHITLKGVRPVKYDKYTGKIKHSLGKGKVGIDIGTSTIAVVGDSQVKLQELAKNIENLEKDIARLQRKLDRSRRITNPDNFNEDGTIKRQGNKKMHWVRSKKYVKTQNLIRDAKRKQAQIRKIEHETLANEIISMGDEFYVEDINFKALQKRAKNTEVSEKTGKYKRKKRFGKSLGNRAPAMLLIIVDRKLKHYGRSLIKINTREARASQYNHTDQTYTKKSLSKRWNNINGKKIQRDLYSAFLIQNINDDLKTFNEESCNVKFDSFLALHDETIKELKGNNNPSCMGV